VLSRGPIRAWLASSALWALAVAVLFRTTW